MASKKSNKVAAVEIQRVKLQDLKPHPKNPRRHPKQGSPEWETMRQSLEHDYFDPVVLNRRNGLLVSGHLRARIMAEIGYQEADCVVVDYDEKTHIRRMIAANRQIGMDDKQALANLTRDMDEATAHMANLTPQQLEDLAGQQQARLKAIETKPPPRMAWVLIGIPVVKYGQISGLIEKIAANQDVKLYQTQNDGQEDRQPES